MAWSAIEADESLIGHAVSAPPTTAPESDRLRWFASRLEHPNPAIAADAFTEFGLAPYASVRAAADAFDDRALARWITDPGVDQRRRGFYGLALGIVAATTDDPATRVRALAAIRDAVAAPADDFLRGLRRAAGGAPGRRRPPRPRGHRSAGAARRVGTGGGPEARRGGAAVRLGASRRHHPARRSRRPPHGCSPPR